VRERLPNLLDPWLQAVKESELPELCRFAAGIERDKSAVLAALSLAWSNGPVEAQVQKLKVSRVYHPDGYRLEIAQGRRG